MPPDVRQTRLAALVMREMKSQPESDLPLLAIELGVAMLHVAGMEGVQPSEVRDALVATVDYFTVPDTDPR